MIDKKAANVYPIARAYLHAGLSVIPIRRDGSKAPSVGTWKEYQTRLPTEEELRTWYDRPKPPGIAIIGGAVSGGLERLDFDVRADVLFPGWQALVEAEAPGLLDHLPLVQTPREPAGYHIYYRCVEVATPSNTKLAEDPTASGRERALIETRGEGGYTIAPGSPPECHERKKPWDHIGGPPLTTIPTITAAEREVLIRCARSFDHQPHEPASLKNWNVDVGGTRPGDDFNRRGPSWSDLLTPHGWTAARDSDGKTYWRRPGKDRGWSATTGVCKSEKSGELFACFSSNASPFEGATGGRPCSCYSKFAVYALLNHGGNFKAAAKELALQGYGERRATRQTLFPPHEGNGHGRDGFWLGPLVLRPGPAHRTPTRLYVPLAVFKNSCQIDAVNLATTARGRKEAAELLSPHFGDTAPDAADIGRVFAAILAAAEHSLDNATDATNPTGPTLRDIVRTRVPQALRLLFVTERGIWSEARRAGITRADFLGFCPGWLVDAAAPATDAPADLPKLLEALRCALAILWSDLREALPAAPAAGLTPETAAAATAQMRDLLTRIWTSPKLHEKYGSGDNAVAESASLISRVRRRHAGPESRENCAGWVPIHSAYSAWWRPSECPPNQHLAMRYDLAGAMGILLPGVHDQLSLTNVCEPMGLLNPRPGVPTRLTGGRRLAVIAADLAAEWLAQPEEDISPDTEEEEVESE